MSEVTDLRNYQQRASEASRSSPPWPRYASPAARLYHLLGVESGVRVNGRLAKLITAREDGCQILWQTGRKTGNYKGGQAYEPMMDVPLEAIEEA